MNWNDGEGSNVEADLRKRLEKCETALRGLLDDCDSDPDRESVKAARAAVEGRNEEA